LTVRRSIAFATVSTCALLVSSSAFAEVSTHVGVGLGFIHTGFGSYTLNGNGALAYEPGGVMRYALTTTAYVTPWRLSTPDLITFGDRTTALIGLRLGRFVPEIGGGVDVFSGRFCVRGEGCDRFSGVGGSGNVRLSGFADERRRGLAATLDAYVTCRLDLGCSGGAWAGGAWAF
jgi:hypothetical protein